MTIICIDGLIGAGKSTVTHRLKKNLYKCYEEPIDKWTLLPNLYNDMKKYATPFQFQVLFLNTINIYLLKIVKKRSSLKDVHGHLKIYLHL